MGHIGHDGIRALTVQLLKLHIRVKALKLHSNQIEQRGAFAIADWLSVSSYGVQEIHLSHNYVTFEGALAILRAIASNPAYPPERTETDSSGVFSTRQIPCWLRFE